MEQTHRTPVPGVEIFAIGTELVIGRIADTNSFWLADQLARLGLPPRRITCLPDDPVTITEAFGEALRRGTEIVLTTGGLGPTPDDRTVECVAHLAGVEVTVDAATIADFMRRRQLTDESQVSPGLRKMATVPVGATVYPNPVGWAPLIALPVGRAMFYLLPGPPREVQALYETHLRPLLAQRSPRTSQACRVLVGMVESEVSPLLEAVMRQYPDTYLKAYVALAGGDGLPVDVVAYGPDAASAEALLGQAVASLGELVQGRGRSFRLTPPA